MRDRLRQRPGPQRGQLTGPNPTDRGKKGSKIHLIVDRRRLPLSIGISAANLHDSQALIPLVRGIPPIRSRRGPRRRRPGKLHADKGYDYQHLRRWLSSRGIRHRIARKDVEPSQRLSRHRWLVERTVSWLSGCRRLHRRYERKPEHFLACTAIAATSLQDCRHWCDLHRIGKCAVLVDEAEGTACAVHWWNLGHSDDRLRCKTSAVFGSKSLSRCPFLDGRTPRD